MPFETSVADTVRHPLEVSQPVSVIAAPDVAGVLRGYDPTKDLSPWVSQAVAYGATAVYPLGDSAPGGRVCRDVSGHRRHGLYVGAPSLPQTGGPGGLPRYVAFNGTNAVRLPPLGIGTAAGATGTPGYSYEAMVRLTSAAAGQWVVSEGHPTNLSAITGISVESAKPRGFTRDDAGVAESASGATSINDGAWHHVVMTWTPGASSAVRVIVDGVQVAIQAGTVGAKTYTLSAIGALARSPLSSFATADVAGVAFYPLVLSTAQAATLRTAAITAPTPTVTRVLAQPPATHREVYYREFQSQADLAGFSIFNSAGNAGHGLRAASQVTVANATDPATGQTVSGARIRAEAKSDGTSQRIYSGIMTSQQYYRSGVLIFRAWATQDITNTMSPVLLRYPPSISGYGWAQNGEDDIWDLGGGNASSDIRLLRGFVHYADPDVTGTASNHQANITFGSPAPNAAQPQITAGEQDGVRHRYYLGGFVASGTTQPFFTYISVDDRYSRRGIPQNWSFQLDATTGETDARFGGAFGPGTFPVNDFFLHAVAFWKPVKRDESFPPPASQVSYTYPTPLFSWGSGVGNSGTPPTGKLGWAQAGNRPGSSGHTYFPADVTLTSTGLVPAVGGTGNAGRALGAMFWDPGHDWSTSCCGFVAEARAASFDASRTITRIVAEEVGTDGSYEVTCYLTWRAGGGSVAHGPMVRGTATNQGTDGSSNVHALLEEDGQVRLYAMDAGTRTQRGVTVNPGTLVDGTVYMLRLRSHPGGFAEVFWDGVAGSSKSATAVTSASITNASIPGSSSSAGVTFAAGASDQITATGLVDGSQRSVYLEAQNPQSAGAWSTLASTVATPGAAAAQMLFWPNWQNHPLGALSASQIDYTGGSFGANTSTGPNRNTWQNGPGSPVDNVTTDGDGTSGNRMSIIADPAGVLLGGATRKVLQIGPVLDTDNKLTGNPRSQWEGPTFIDGTVAGGYEVYIGMDFWFPATTDSPGMPAVPYGQWLNIGEVWGSPFTNACPMALMVTQLEQQSSPEYLKGIIQGGFTPRVPETFIIPATRRVWHSMVWHLNVSNDDTPPRTGFMEMFYNGGAGWQKLKLFNGLKRYNYFNFNPNGDQEPNKPHVLAYRSVGWATSLALLVGHWRVASSFALAAPPTYGTPPAVEPT